MDSSLSTALQLTSWTKPSNATRFDHLSSSSIFLKVQEQRVRFFGHVLMRAILLLHLIFSQLFTLNELQLQKKKRICAYDV